MSARSVNCVNKTVAESDRPTQRLVALAVLIGEWSLLGGTAPLWEDCFRWSIWIVAAMATAVLGRRFGDFRNPLPSGACLLTIVVVGAWPVLCRAISWADVPGGGVAPWEIVLARALTGMALVGAALSAWPRIARLAAAMSAFLILFSHAFGDTSIPFLRALIALYAALSCSWLMLDYQRQTQSMAAAARHRLPARRRWLIGVGLALIAFAAGSWSFPPASQQLGAWFASSGGNRRADPTARAGRQDGGGTFRSDQVPESIGFAESQHYLDSPRPSLYDLYNESLGEPAPSITAGRTKVLTADQVQTSRRNPAASFEADTKTFSTTRNSPRPKDVLGDRAGKALCLMQGPAPLHLRWAVYDRFDGVAWREAPGISAREAIRATGRDTWMERTADDLKHGIDVDVTVKVIKLTTNRVPTPADPVNFRCGAVDLPDYFAWLDDGVLSMRHQKFLPPGAMFEFVCRHVDDATAAAATFTLRDDARQPQRNSGQDVEAEKKIDELIHSWIGSTPHGLAQVSMIAAALQRHATLDSTAVVPPVVTDSTVYFLLLSPRAPDYLFASTAADVLARLGYRSRLAGGFYAGPQTYDSATDHYSLYNDDLHFWAEVQDDDGRWHIVEATPGYELRRPVLPWTERIWQTVLGQLDQSRRRLPILLGFVVAMILAVSRHREGRDWFATRCWYAGVGRSSPRRVCDCLRIVLRRARVAGMKRSQGETLIAFAQRLGELRPGTAQLELQRVAAWAEQIRFAATKSPFQFNTAVCEQTCHTVLDAWTLARLRTLKSTTPSRFFAFWELPLRWTSLVNRRPTV